MGSYLLNNILVHRFGESSRNSRFPYVSMADTRRLPRLAVHRAIWARRAAGRTVLINHFLLETTEYRQHANKWQSRIVIDDIPH